MSRRFKYALQADNSSITNITTSSFRTTDSISTNISTGVINVSSISGINANFTNISTGTIKVNTLIDANGTVNTIGNIIMTGGNIGFGTTSPSSALHINTTNTFGTLYLSNSIQNRKVVLFSTANNDHKYYGMGINAGSYRFQVDDPSINFDYYAATSNTSSNLVMRLGGNGNLFVYGNISSGNMQLSGGITASSASLTTISTGNITPGDKLDVMGHLRIGNSTQSNYIAFRGTFGDGNGNYDHAYIGERIYAPSEFSELLIFKGNDASGGSGPDRIRLLAPELRFDTVGFALSGAFDTVGTYGSTRMLIDQNGNVGIGTVSPTVALDVNGTIAGTNMQSTSSITSNSLRLTGTASSLDMRGSGNVNINIQNVGAGASQTKIHSNNDGKTYFQSSGDVIFAGIDSTAVRSLYLAVSGNVGIGKTSPGYELDVNGTASATVFTGGNMRLSGAITCAGFRVNNGDCYISTGNLKFRNNGNGIEWMSGATIVSEILDDGNLKLVTDDIIYFRTAGVDRFNVNSYGINAGNVNASEVGRWDYSMIKSGYGGIHAGYISTFNGDGTINTFNSDYNSLTRDGLYIRGGRIGVGTGSPGYPLHVNGSVNLTYDPNFFINGPGVADPGNQNGNFSAYFSNAIRASEIWGNSDERIKTNIADINDPDSLQIIRRLKPKTFSFINDWNSMSELRVNYGFIAQEVETILPDAVTHSKESLPTIMETCNVNIIKDANDAVIGTKINMSTKSIPDNWKSNTKVQIIDKNGQRSLVTVKSIESSKTFIIDEKLEDTLYFVYGEEVDDFRSVHKDVIYAITTAAVQEIDKDLQSAQIKIMNQENLINSQNDKIINLENQVSILQNQINTILEKLN